MEAGTPPASGQTAGLCTLGVCQAWSELPEGAACEGVPNGDCAPDLTCNFAANRCEPDPMSRPIVSRQSCGGV